MKLFQGLLFVVALLGGQSASAVCAILPPDEPAWGYGASPIQFTGTPTAFNAGGQVIAIYPTATVCGPEGQNVSLKLTGYGLYQKPVGFIKVNVYVISSYAENPAAISASNPLPGLKASAARAVQFTMVRSVNVDEIRTHFEAAMEKNGVDLSEPDVAGMFAQLKEGLNINESATLVGLNLVDDEEWLHIEMPTRAWEGVGPGLSMQFWKTWFGNQFIDTGMKAIKSLLLKNVSP